MATERTRLTPKERRARILDAALGLAEKHGYLNITRKEIAESAGCSVGLVTTRLGAMEKLRDLLMREAVRRGLDRIVLAGLVNKHPVAMKAPEEIKARARGLLK